MRLQEDIDFTTLNWVKGELDETLKLARHALEAYIADPGDVSQMRFCATYLHQVQGTLRMVELYGAALVTEEMEKLAAAVQERLVSAPSVAFEVLMDGIVQLPDYLERLQSGQKDIPVVLLPLLNQLRAARGEAELTESALFAPDITCPMPMSAAGPSVALPDLELQQLAKVARGQFQVALLRWFKGVDADANLKRLIDVCDRLVSVVSQDEGRRLFWIAGAVLSGVESGGIPMDAGLKQVVGRVEREIKHLSESGDTGFRVDPPRELTRNLLYFAAHAAPDNQRTAELKDIYSLMSLIPSKDEVESAGRGVNDSLYESVAGNIKEDLLRVKDALDLFLRKNDRQISQLAPQLPVLDSLADTLSMLGAGVAQRIIQDQHDVLASVVRGDQVADEALMLDVAGALLHAESLLDDRSLQSAARGKGEVSDSAVPLGEQRKVMEAVLKEAQANFGQAKQCFVAFVESNWDHVQLADVPRLLSEVMGALRMLEVPLASDLLDAIARFSDIELLRMKRVPNGQQMDTLADALAGLEYFLEALREHRSGRDKILAGVQHSLEMLGYWPLDGRGALAEDAVFEPSSPAAVQAQADEDSAEIELEVQQEVHASDVIDPVLESLSGGSESPAGLEVSLQIVDSMPAHLTESLPIQMTSSVELAGFQLGGEDIDEEIREVFVEEVQEEIDNLSQLLPQWNSNPDNLELVKPIRRVFHTLKGSGRLVGATTLGEFSWRVENMLNRVLDQTISPSAEVRHLVLAAHAMLPSLLAALRGESGLRADIDGVQATAEALASGELRFYAGPQLVSSVTATDSATHEHLGAVDVDDVSAPLPANTSDSEFVGVLTDSDEAVGGDSLDEFAELPTTVESASPLEASLLVDTTETLLEATDAENSAVGQSDLDISLEIGDLVLDESMLSLEPVDASSVEMLAESAVSNAEEVLQDNGNSAVHDAAEPFASVIAEPAILAHIDPDLFEILRPEVLGHLETIDAYVASSWLQPRVVEDSLLRAVHTINGAFAMTEVETVVEVTAPLEGYVKRLLSASEAPTEEGLALIQTAADALRHYLVAMGDSSHALPAYSDLVTALCAARDQLPEPVRPVIDAGQWDADGFTAVVASDGAAPSATFGSEHAADSADAAESGDAGDGVRLSEMLSSFGELDFASEMEAHAALPDADQFAPAELHGLQVVETDGDGRSPFWEEAGSQPSTPPVGSALTTDELIDAADAEALLQKLAVELGEEVSINRGVDDASRDEVTTLSLEDFNPVELVTDTARAEVELALLDANPSAPETASLDAATDESTTRWVDLGEIQTLGGPSEHAALETQGWEDADSLASQPANGDAEGGEQVELAALEISDEVEFGVAAESLLALNIAAPELSAVDALDQEPPGLIARRFEIPAEDDAEGELDTSDVDLDLLDVFMEEGVDILDHSDGVLAQLRDAPSDSAPVVALQRDLHTLKGGARMAGLAPIGDLAHVMESLLEAVAHGNRDLGTFGIEVLERGFDRLHQMVARVGQRQAIQAPTHLLETVEYLLHGDLPSFVDSPSLGDSQTTQNDLPSGLDGEVSEIAGREIDLSASDSRVDDQEVSKRKLPPPIRSVAIETALDEDDTGSRAPQEQIRIRADLLDRLVNYAGEVAIYRARLEQQLGSFRGNLGELDQTTSRLRDQLRKLEIETEAQILSRYQRQQDEGDTEFDPLELDRFSTLQQLSRALSESAADIVNLQHTLEDLTRQYETLLLQQSRVSSDLQEGLMRTRMVPFDSLVPRLRRILRQTSSELGLKAQLRVDGAQGEMDRNILDRMTAPLEHMLRNALAHGIESPEQRVAVGKLEEGVIRITVAREASEVLIRVADDGRGMSRDVIRRKAIERGLMKPDAQLTDRDIYGFILESGFSTAESVSKVAGRGVGMDVVYNEIRQLGGSLHIESSEGQGSEFVIRLPFTLAVTQAVFVKIGETTFAVPITSVQGVSRIDRAELEKQLASGTPTFRYAGEDYAIHDLGVLLGQASARAVDSLQVPLVLARSGDQRAAICVDNVLGSREIVVKSTGPQVSSIPGIFGATMMGDGRVVIILDLAPMVRRAIAANAEGVLPIAHVPDDSRQVPLVMVVDDSITMRKVTSRVLERHGLEVTTAKDGVDAIEKLVDRVPDVMLLDIEMPRMDGYELATHMRNDARLKSVPIIMITSRTGDKHRQRAFEIGVDRYLGKPYQESDLMRNVQEILQGARERRH
ncbi:MAG: Hpt domain-containing protein [Aquimonas sp.]|nr:Hpt domain-containing protein [Aquimonas sp.]